MNNEALAIDQFQKRVDSRLQLLSAKCNLTVLGIGSVLPPAQVDTTVDLARQIFQVRSRARALLDLVAADL